MIVFIILLQRYSKYHKQKNESGIIKISYNNIMLDLYKKTYGYAF